MIVRGTTPLIRCCMLDSDNRNINLSGYDNVILTVSDGKHKVDVDKTAMTFNADNTFDCYLTQEETLQLNGYEVEIQVRAKKTISGVDSAIASDICNMELSQILKEGAI